MSTRAPAGTRSTTGKPEPGPARIVAEARTRPGAAIASDAGVAINSAATRHVLSFTTDTLLSIAGANSEQAHARTPRQGLDRIVAGYRGNLTAIRCRRGSAQRHRERDERLRQTSRHEIATDAARQP